MYDPLTLTESNVSIRSFTRYVQESRHSIVHDNDKPAIEFLAVSNAFGGEAGELQNIVKKIVLKGVLCKDHTLHDDFVLEAGDALHYLFSLIDLSGYSVEYIMACNVRKLDARKQDALETQATLFPSTAPQP